MLPFTEELAAEVAAEQDNAPATLIKCYHGFERQKVRQKIIAKIALDPPKDFPGPYVNSRIRSVFAFEPVFKDIELQHPYGAQEGFYSDMQEGRNPGNPDTHFWAL